VPAQTHKEAQGKTGPLLQCLYFNVSLHANNGNERLSRRKNYSAYDAPSKETPALIGTPFYLKDIGLTEKFL